MKRNPVNYAPTLPSFTAVDPATGAPGPVYPGHRGKLKIRVKSGHKGIWGGSVQDVGE
jgi:hypothetical protein